MRPKFLLYTHVVGIPFENDDGSNRQEMIDTYCKEGTPLLLVAEKNNPYDKNAIAVYVSTGHNQKKQIGYLSRKVAAKLRPEIDKGAKLGARIFILDEVEIEIFHFNYKRPPIPKPGTNKEFYYKGYLTVFDFYPTDEELKAAFGDLSRQEIYDAIIEFNYDQKQLYIPIGRLLWCRKEYELAEEFFIKGGMDDFQLSGYWASLRGGLS